MTREWVTRKTLKWIDFLLSDRIQEGKHYRKCHILDMATRAGFGLQDGDPETALKSLRRNGRFSIVQVPGIGNCWVREPKPKEQPAPVGGIGPMEVLERFQLLEREVSFLAQQVERLFGTGIPPQEGGR